MNESQRREWLGTLLDNQIKALASQHGKLTTIRAFNRQLAIDTLCLVEGIEIPKETS